MYVRVYVCMYVRVYVCVYVHVYVRVHVVTMLPQSRKEAAQMLPSHTYGSGVPVTRATPEYLDACI